MSNFSKPLLVSGSPHVHGSESTKKIMWGVVIALIPSLLLSIYFFGLPAIKTISVSVISCLLFEWLINKYLLKKPCSICDGSGFVTGLLLAFNLPSTLPIYMTVLGALFAIGIGKMVYGGLGNNPFNPALVGRVFLLISFPVAMTTYPLPSPMFGESVEPLSMASLQTSSEAANFDADANSGASMAWEETSETSSDEAAEVDATSGPTPLSFMKEGIKKGIPVQDLMTQFESSLDLAIGKKGGSLGEISVLAILLGGLFMLFRRIITWHIPVAFIGSAFIFAFILNICKPAEFPPASFAIMSGGLMLGAVFMATDMVTSPMTPLGKLIFGIGCGVITILIRTFGSYPEGVSFAILIMNAFVPLLNRAFPPKRYGC